MNILALLMFFIVIAFLLIDIYQRMGKKNQNNFNTKRKQKQNSAVTFDEEERSNFLKGMFGAKKRRKQFNKKRVEE